MSGFFSVCKCVLGAHGGQKRTSYPPPLELELWVAVSWELNPGPLQEQQVLQPLCQLSRLQGLVLLLLTMFTYVCLYIRTCECSCPYRPEEGVRFFFLGLELEAGVSLLHWVARNQAQVLCKAIFSLDHNCLPRPRKVASTQLLL